MRILSEGAVDLGQEPFFARHPPRPSVPVPLVCAVIVWLVAIAMFYLDYHPGESRIPENFGPGRCVFELREDARQGSYGSSAVACVRSSMGEFDVRIAYDGPRRFMACERIEAYAVFEDFESGEDERYARQGVAASARLTDVREEERRDLIGAIVDLRRRASALFDGETGKGAALLRALTTGDRIDLERDGLYDDMKALGLAHIVAVSGSHLAVVGAMASAVLARAGCPRRVLAAALCVFYGAYAVFTGMSAPVVRAALMASVVALAVWAGRRASPLSALGMCVCVLIALDPSNAMSISFFLSAGSTLGVIVLSPLFASWLSTACGGGARSLVDAFSLTAAAGIPIAPVTLAVFSRVSLVAPLANGVAAPVFGVFLGAGLAAVSVGSVFPAAGEVVLAPVIFAADAFCACAEYAAGFSYVSFPATGDGVLAGVFAAAAVVLLWAWWPRFSAAAVRLGACASCLAIALTVAAASVCFPDEVVMLDVGQGDAILIRSQGSSLLVDTGNQEQKLFSALARNRVSSIGGVAISHHDDDHCGCLGLLRGIVSGSVYLAEGSSTCGCDGCRELVDVASEVSGSGAPVFVSRGDTVRVGRFSCTAVWPKSFEDEGGNADSLCFLVSYDAQGDGAAESHVLLTGDAEAEQIAQMVDSLSKGVEVVKAGHHGSRAGMTPDLAREIGASAVLVSVGRGNRYGHPAPETIAAFEEAGSRVFRTDRHGDVSCRFDGESISVVMQKEDAAA